MVDMADRLVTSGWVGIDLGTQSIRVLAVDDDGRRLASATAALTSTRSAGRHEQDPAEWIRLTWQLLNEVTSSIDAGVSIRAIAVSGTSGTIVPMDRAGRPAGPAVMYDDRRGAPRLDEVQHAGAALWDRLGYRMQATWGLPKVLVMRATADPGTVFGHQPDVITAALSGRLLPSDLSSALKTGADLDAVAWPTDLLDHLDVPVEALNDVVASGTVLGTVSAAASRSTGLPRGCAIVAGMTDGCAAQLAAGAVVPGTWNAVLGTTLVIKGAADRRFTDPSGAVYAHRAPFNSGWYPGGASSTGAGAVSALLPHRDLDAVTSEAAALSGIPVVYPLIGKGERFPFVDDTAEPIWPADPATMSDPELLRAIAFGTAFVERLAFELLDDVGYDTSGIVHLTGGGARNRWWNSIRAQILHRPVAVAGNTEGAAGMALLAAAAHVGDSKGRPLDAAAQRMIATPTPVSPADESDDAIEDAYQAFVAQLKQRGYVTESHALR